MASSLYLARLNVLADGPSLFSSMSTPSELPSANKKEQITRNQVIRSHQCTRPRICEGGSLRSTMLSEWLKANLLRLRPAVSTESSVRLSADEEDNSESSSFSHFPGGAGKGQFFGKLGTSATKAETNLWLLTTYFTSWYDPPKWGQQP